jgi:hypothetical protein
MGAIQMWVKDLHTLFEKQLSSRSEKKVVAGPEDKKGYGR